MDVLVLVEAGYTGVNLVISTLISIKDDHGSTSSLVGGKGTSIGKLMEQDERNTNLSANSEMKLQFHPVHPFHLLLDKSRKFCHVCKKEIWYDICYSCVQCDLHLHASCAKSLNRVLKSTSHIHNLYYFGPNIEAKGFKYEMQKCGKCRKMLRSNSLSFCMECDTKLHVECALPPSLKSKYHLHSCTLKLGFMEDDSGQNYCDICEEERDTEDHVYYCTECQGHFVAHMNCMLNSEEEITAEGSSNMALDFPSTSGWAERESVSIDEYSEEDDQISIDEYSEEDDQSNSDDYSEKDDQCNSHDYSEEEN
ncbi:hypothetical protein J1N35_045193 [Gossypium stocksii]|uniref:Phorbol-ester/DAG-type domain-containing protein n=1 Tax=Gossypium stocksii TaxID=47602 RepID=A0A9D3ZGA9_9ROSI|nr:hypothetical protein J1N35_045193 [Gossypium stocksii]